MEGVGEGLDPEFEGPEFGRGFEAFHFFGHKRLVSVVPRMKKEEVNEICVRRKKDKGRLKAVHHYFYMHKKRNCGAHFYTLFCLGTPFFFLSLSCCIDQPTSLS